MQADPTAATAPLDGVAPLNVLLRRSTGSPADVRSCARLLLEPARTRQPHDRVGRRGPDVALFDAVERRDLALVQLLVERGATKDDDAFYHACEQSNTALLDLLYEPGHEGNVNHKLDFEDAAGLQWFLERGVDVDANRCLHHAISRGRGLRILTMLLDAGADVNLPWDRWDRGRRPLALAARCGHLAAYELLASRGATAELDAVDAAVLAVARGESVQLPRRGRRRSVTRPAMTSAGSSVSSRCSGVPTSCERCSTAAWPSTPEAGATSRRSTRPPCTDAPRRCSC